MTDPSHHRTHRLAAGLAATILTIGLAAAPAAAADRHRRHHQGGLLSHRQQECLARHGIPRPRPWSDLRDPATRARFVQALRECGVLPSAPAGPTTTTTTAPPIITS
jgi:hypothetical protein